MIDREPPDFWNALEPLPPLAVAEWAEEHLYISERTSARAGFIRLEPTPYLRFPLQCFTDPDIVTIDLCSGTQIGKTIFLFCIAGYIIDYAPGPTLWLYPIKDLATSVSKERIQPLILDSPALRRHLTKTTDDFQLLRYTMDRMTIDFAWNSMASVSSHPKRYVLKDETKDVDPEILAASDDRTKTYTNRKIVAASSPLLPWDSVWRATGLVRDHEAENIRATQLGPEAANRLPIRRWKPRDGSSLSVYRYQVPCPHCKAMQELHPDRIDWPRDIAIRKIGDAGWYECEACGGHIGDAHKPAMVRGGVWHSDSPGSSAVAFHLSSLYSTLGASTRFGEIAARYLKTKRDPKKYKAFVNGYLAWPWEEEEHGTPTIDMTALAATLATAHMRNQPPPGVRLCTIGADVAKSHFDWQIWGWGEGASDRDGYLLAWGVEPVDMDTDPEEPLRILIELRTRLFGGYRPIAAAVDSRYKQDVVQGWARTHRWILPIVGGRGNETRKPDTIEQYVKSAKPIDKGIAPLANPPMFYTLNTGVLKSVFLNGLRSTPPTMHLPRDIDQWVIDQYNSEKEVFRPGKGWFYVVKRKQDDDAATVQNHQLDSACYARACLEILAPNMPVSDAVARYRLAPSQAGGATQPARPAGPRQLSKGVKR